jgi:cytosine/adenosine deaminase-related metal-dependent hydrolase
MNTFMCVNMKNLSRVLCLLAFSCAHAQSSTVAIRGVTVVDVKDGSLDPEQTVLVAGNRIAAVGSVREVAVPDDARVVEAAGRYLIPGLWDMHVHSVANVALDSSLRSVAAQDWHFPLFPRSWRHWRSQHERRHRDVNARTEQDSQDASWRQGFFAGHRDS